MITTAHFSFPGTINFAENTAFFPKCDHSSQQSRKNNLQLGYGVLKKLKGLTIRDIYGQVYQPWWNLLLFIYWRKDHTIGLNQDICQRITLDPRLTEFESGSTGRLLEVCSSPVPLIDFPAKPCSLSNLSNSRWQVVDAEYKVRSWHRLRLLYVGRCEAGSPRFLMEQWAETWTLKFWRVRYSSLQNAWLYGISLFVELTMEIDPLPKVYDEAQHGARYMPILPPWISARNWNATLEIMYLWIHSD